MTNETITRCSHFQTHYKFRRWNLFNKFKEILEFIKELKKDNNRVQALKANNKVIITNSKEKANVFNSHFKSVFTNEPDYIP